MFSHMTTAANEPILGKRARKPSANISYDNIPLSDEDESTSTDDKDSATNPSRRKSTRKSDAPCSVFLMKAHTIVTLCPADIGGWSADGASFIVKDSDRFAAEVIPTAYKHNHWSSFVRQLNSYGFRKVKCDPLSTSSEFSHPFFVKGKTDLLRHIKRPATSLTSSGSTEVESEVSDLKLQISTLEDKLSVMTDIVSDLNIVIRSLLNATAQKTNDNTITSKSAVTRTNSNSSARRTISGSSVRRTISGSTSVFRTTSGASVCRTNSFVLFENEIDPNDPFYIGMSEDEFSDLVSYV
jgi:heat shock transcription factor, other eukaryote